MKAAKICITLGKKGRRCGESHGRAKLTDHDVDLAHSLAQSGMTAPQIARKLGVTRGHIWRVLNGLRHAVTPEQVRTIDLPKRRRQA